ncbi:hypothetical protein HHK36_032734 [Tetracentron sinense]|uniref:Uncharacterized protein n=1 Tax=Tetracentron sinense TaxID=13715 RepID=A0A834Y9S6_TETSI|nr:hypothetical protein HHK36_032734 [Tetracentron sinense]
MPGKKRKSVKKRKQWQPIPPLKSVVIKTTNNDMNSHDEKESDGGEASSPASLDHHNHLLAQKEEEEEEEKRGFFSFGSVVTACDKSMEGSANGEGKGTQKVEPDKEVDWVVRELQPDGDSKSKTVSIEYVKESRHGDSNGESRSSDTSSSDEQSGLFEKSLPMMEPGELEEEVHNSVIDVEYFGLNPCTNGHLETQTDKIKTPDHNDPVLIISKFKSPPTTETALPTLPVDWLSEEVTKIVEATPFENTGASDVIELVSKEKEVKMLPPLDENTRGFLDVKDLVSKENEDKMLLLSAENNGSSSGVMDLATKENEDKLLQSSDAPIVEASNGGEHCKKSESPESSESRVRKLELD